MQKLHFSILINSPKEKVWNTMLNDTTYRQWTDVFGPGSHFIGSWDQGADIKFLAPNDKGSVDGMISRIKENRLYEYISIEHQGTIHEGKEDTSSDAVQEWAGARENYTLKDMDGRTEVLIDIDIEANYVKMFEEMWPKALQKLKQIAEAKTLETVTVETIVQAPLEKVWESWNEPKHIVKWCYASEDWEAPSAENDLRTGGKFKTFMTAKDRSSGFDFGGIYTQVKPLELIEYEMGDGRKVKIEFSKDIDGVKIIETFEIENVNSKELQRQGWQAILNNFKKYTESY